MVTLKDIAIKSGYSVSAVSKALNNADDITYETKIKIQKLAQQMGYVRNENAASLSSKNKKINIAVIARTNTDYNYIDEITSKISIAATLTSHNLDMDTITIYDDILESFSAVEVENYLRQKNISGLVLFGIDRPEHKFEFLVSNKDFKVVLVDVPFFNESTSAVTIDNRAAQREIAEALIQTHDIKRILYIAGHPDSAVSTDRLLGISDFMMENPNTTVKKTFGLYSKDKAVEIVKTEKLKNYDAIICANDLMAIAVKNYLLSIDSDMLVAGFDGLRLLDYLPYHIPTVRQNHVTIAKLAVNELNRLLKEKNSYGQILFDKYEIIT